MDEVPFEWEAGEVVERAYVEIDGVKHYVTPATYEGGTSLSAFHLNKMQQDLIDYLKSITQEKYNLITDGNPVKTGRKIDNRDEYVRRITCANLGGNGAAKQYYTGIDTSLSTITDIKLFGVTSAGNIFPLPNNDSASSKITILTNGNLQIVFYNDYWVNETAYAEIYYI